MAECLHAMTDRSRLSLLVSFSRGFEGFATNARVRCSGVSVPGGGTMSMRGAVVQPGGSLMVLVVGSFVITGGRKF